MGRCRRRRGWTGRKQSLAKWNQCATAAARQEAEVPDADKAARQHMQQESTQELIDVQSQKPLLILVS
jgi:hypothetical protein